MLLTILVFNDASWLHLGQAEGLYQKFHAACLEYLFFIHFAVKVHDAAVRANGARANVVDIISALPFDEGDFDISHLLSCLGENLDANVFRNTRLCGVHVALPVEDHGVRTWAGGIVFERQVFV